MLPQATLQAQPKAVKQIEAILAQQKTDWNKGNISAFMQGYLQSDSLLFIGSKGLVYGWQNTLNSYKKSYPTAAAMQTLAFTELKFVKLSKRYYMVIGKWQLSSHDSKGAGGYFSLLFNKTKHGWKIIIDHSS